MDDLKIYELMAKTPDIRAVQISDTLDQDLAAVSATLRALVEVGHVVKHSGIGPNGIGAQMYNLSEEFRKSRDGAALLARIGPVAIPKAIVAPVADEVPAAPQQPLAQARSKVDRGVAFVLKNGSASDDEMRAAMDVPKPAAPAAYLVAAIKAGKLHKDGAMWKPGRAVPAIVEQVVVTSPPETLVAQVREAVQLPAAPVPVERDQVAASAPLKRLKTTLAPAQNKPLDVPTFVPRAADPGPAPAEPDPVAAPVYRCALWSDGVLEVRRNGQTVAEMPQAAGESLAAFLARLAGHKEAA